MMMMHPSMTESSEEVRSLRGLKNLPKVKEGVKYDDGKLRMELIPSEMLEELAKVLTFGANKYADRNWEKGMDWGRVYGALLRHLTAWWGGQDKDPETGESHLSHALCCLTFLSTYERRNIGEDTRVTK